MDFSAPKMPHFLLDPLNSKWNGFLGQGGDCSMLALREGVNYRHSLTVWSHCVSQLPLPLTFGSRPHYPPPNGLSDWGWCKCAIFGFTAPSAMGKMCHFRGFRPQMSPFIFFRENPKMAHLHPPQSERPFGGG